MINKPTVIRQVYKNGISINVVTSGNSAYVQTYSVHIGGRTILESEMSFSSEEKATDYFIGQIKILNAS